MTNSHNEPDWKKQLADTIETVLNDKRTKTSTVTAPGQFAVSATVEDFITVAIQHNSAEGRTSSTLEASYEEGDNERKLSITIAPWLAEGLGFVVIDSAEGQEPVYLSEEEAKKEALSLIELFKG